MYMRERGGGESVRENILFVSVKEKNPYKQVIKQRMRGKENPAGNRRKKRKKNQGLQEKNGREGS